MEFDDYPAAHSMDTNWYAVDGEGRVGLFMAGAEGAYPGDAYGGHSLHHGQGPNQVAILRRLLALRPAHGGSANPPDEEDEDLGESVDGLDGDQSFPEPIVIAETETPVRTMTVSMAVMQLDLTEAQAIVFRNAAHGGLSVVYRRADGNIGWIDPERTKSTNGEGTDGTAEG